MPRATRLFSEFPMRSINVKNRIWVSPMCQYSSVDGHPTDWHFVHLGSRAAGGAGLVMVEATAVSPEGRISPDDSGMWDDAHTEPFLRLSRCIQSYGAVSAIQLAHAGRKASTAAPWHGGKFLAKSEGGWQTIAPSAIPFSDGDGPPREMTKAEIKRIVSDFVAAAKRALNAGFQVIELHMAHGYLMHEFLSPLSNQRRDEYGGSLENRMRFPLEVAAAVRAVWPAEFPLFARISATDWEQGPVELAAASAGVPVLSAGWDLEDSVILSQKLASLGVDLIDCSTGGTLASANIPVGPGYQVPFAQAIRRDGEIATAAVGMISDPIQAESILVTGQADAIFMAREFLRDPYWPVRAAKVLGVKIERPKQYGRS